MRGDIEVDAGPMLAFIDATRAATGAHVTPLHVVGKAVAHALASHPELNVHMAGGRLIPRRSVDVTIIATFAGGTAQAGITIADLDRKPVAEVARELEARAATFREGTAPAIGRVGTIVDHLPLWTIAAVLRLGVWLTMDRGIDLGVPGLRPGGFGGAIVTSLGGEGIDHAYPMLNRFMRTPVSVMVGRVAERPVAIGGRVEVRPTVTIGASLDHRYLDGSHAARFAASIREYLADPAAFEPPKADAPGGIGGPGCAG